jgi:hypothetical protein
MLMGESLLRRLHMQAEVVRRWNLFELGTKPPPPMNYDRLADLLDEAAKRIEDLERDR